MVPETVSGRKPTHGRQRRLKGDLDYRDLFSLWEFSSKTIEGCMCARSCRQDQFFVTGGDFPPLNLLSYWEATLWC